jgi:UDP-N-acetyl-2-amino-2-deoxyglucuronate dehydrogenase
MTSFALVGAAGYIAPRHMHAMKAVGGNLTVAFDPKDSVGIIDNYFPQAHFFTEFERFDRHIDKLRRRSEGVDHIAICSPNYLHDAHCRMALRSQADAICEKPLVLNPWNLDGLAELEQSSGRRISTILQLRLHPAIENLRKKIAAAPNSAFGVDLTYITSRGRWYHVSWKGDDVKSGGVATNIGVHFFDMLVHVFGPPSTNVVHLRDGARASGFLVCGRANVRWFLSVDADDVPATEAARKRTFRSITVNGDEIDFTDGFADLHVRSYEEILAGRGFGIATVRPAIEIASAIRSSPIESARGEIHPFAAKYVRRAIG